MRLFPHKATFFDLFDQHAAQLVSIAAELRDLFRHFDRLEERQTRVKELEHACDELTHKLATEMHRNFVTPLDKEDIAALASGLDDVADLVDAAAVRIILYQIPASSEEAKQLSEYVYEATKILQSGISCLRTTSEREKVIHCSREIHRLEHESDAVYRQALGTLFNTPGVDPIMVLKWKEIYERLEMAVDQVEDVANVLEAIQLKYA